MARKKQSNYAFLSTQPLKPIDKTDPRASLSPSKSDPHLNALFKSMSAMPGERFPIKLPPDTERAKWMANVKNNMASRTEDALGNKIWNFFCMEDPDSNDSVLVWLEKPAQKAGQ